MIIGKSKIISILLILVVFFLGVLYLSNLNKVDEQEEKIQIPESTILVPNYSNTRYGQIYLAGGCFWGVQAYFDRVEGIVYTNVGYANGDTEYTNYYELRNTNHVEAMYLVYDKDIISLETILGYYYSVIDPTIKNRQGNDIGTQYRTGIYYVEEGDVDTINRITEEVGRNYSKPIVTEIEPIRNYIIAEDFHQDYLAKNPDGYCHIDLSYIPQEKPYVYKSDYKKPSLDEIRAKLSRLQFSITQENDTEVAFQNPYWNNDEEGIYVDIVTGEPLFLSRDKYDSGSGWPSFTRPIQWNVVNYTMDESYGMKRIEVRSRVGDSHLGHVFEDGPKGEGGLRFCINSGALEFIHMEDMDKRGYGEFIDMVKK